MLRAPRPLLLRNCVVLPCLLLALAGVAVGMASVRSPSVAPAAPLQPEKHSNKGVVRTDLRFPCGKDMCAVWRFSNPTSAGGPVILMGHGFAGTRDVALEQFAEAFAAAGYGTFVFDYRYFGDSGGSPRQLIDPWKQLEDWRAAIEFLRTDAAKGRDIVLWGSSQGAGHALIIAAEDRAISAVIAQAPLIDTRIEGDATRIGIVRGLGFLLTAWADLINSLFSEEAITIPVVARPGESGFLADHAAFEAFSKLAGPQSRYRNAVAARSILTYDDYNPAVHLDGIRVPVLIVASRGDRFAPYSAVDAFAAKSANVSIATIDGDHFDIYSPPRSDRAIEAQLAFLAQASQR